MTSLQKEMKLVSVNNGYIVTYYNGSGQKIFKTLAEAVSFIQRYIRKPWEGDND